MECNGKFSNCSNLKENMEKKHGWIKCCEEECNEELSNWSNWKEHMKEKHGMHVCEEPECIGRFSRVYESKEELEHHSRRKHSKECEEKLVCRNEKEQQKREEHRNGLVCDFCDEKFKNKSELEEHWERDHEIHVYECIHLKCEEKYICQKMWREHMKEKHGIGFYCEQCNQYCLFEEELEEHMKEFHVAEELEEHMKEFHVTEFECVECNEKFESVDKVIEHKNEGECDQCGK